MPELPEVESVARGLRGAALGACIEEVRCHLPLVVGRDPCQFDEQVRGRTLDQVRRHGKYMFLRLSGERVLALHLRMTGQFYLVGREAPPDKHTHLEILLCGRPDKLVYRDVRKFGRLLLLEGSVEEFLRARGLGPDALAVSPAWFVRALGGTSRGIKAALLDQSFIAGLGNIYTDEVLFREGIHPQRSASSLEPEQARALLRRIRRVLRAAIARSGTTVSDFVTADGSEGGFQGALQVYGREGEPCRRCGRTIERIRAAGRSTYLCRNCQS